MSNTMLSERGKAFLWAHREQLTLSLILFLIAFLSFGLGRLSVIYTEKEDIEILYPEVKNELLPKGVLSGPTGAYVASKTGTTYFPVTCGRWKDISEENRLYFKSTEEVEARGYVLAESCK